MYRAPCDLQEHTPAIRFIMESWLSQRVPRAAPYLLAARIQSLFSLAPHVILHQVPRLRSDLSLDRVFHCSVPSLPCRLSHRDVQYTLYRPVDLLACWSICVYCSGGGFRGKHYQVSIHHGFGGMYAVWSCHEYRAKSHSRGLLQLPAQSFSLNCILCGVCRTRAHLRFSSPVADTASSPPSPLLAAEDHAISSRTGLRGRQGSFFFIFFIILFFFALFLPLSVATSS